MPATRGNQIVAVVSAMGDTTDELLALAREVSDRPDAREMDVLLSTGELRSCALVAMALRSAGRDAVSLSGAQAGIRTDTSFGRARIAGVEPRRILDELAEGRIVVVAGFQGITEGMDTTTLGRGASDLTAVAVAAGLGAARCEVYTDVEGIYTADPRIVPDARRLDEVGFEEMLEMASYGAKMNPRAIELAMVYDVPILVASSFGDAPGTLIHKGADMNPPIGEIRDRVRAIATDDNVAKITLFGLKDRPGIASSLFGPLARGRHQRRRDRAERELRRRDRLHPHRETGRPRRGAGGGRAGGREAGGAAGRVLRPLRQGEHRGHRHAGRTLAMPPRCSASSPKTTST